MIKDFLKKLEFISTDSILYQKEYPLQKYVIKIDTVKSKIFYRSDEQTIIERIADKQIQLGDKTTSNFSKEENFGFTTLWYVISAMSLLTLLGFFYLEKRYERK